MTIKHIAHLARRMFLRNAADPDLQNFWIAQAKAIQADLPEPSVHPAPNTGNRSTRPATPSTPDKPRNAALLVHTVFLACTVERRPRHVSPRPRRTLSPSTGHIRHVPAPENWENR